MALVAVATYYNSFEAGIARSRLEADGIPSILFDFNSSMEGASFLVPIRLMVDEEDVEEAARILAEDLTQ
ncbi:MAG TPA: DUF2007 domain-containing protein [Allosphingosinicella sp.]|nr:DUF2007 domain-containing protein [Allosphingosinicella sp.]